MQIDDASFRITQDPSVSRVRSGDGPPRARGEAAHEVLRGDTARTTLLARLTSEALRPLREEPAVREDQVARFKEWAADETAGVPDEAIDVIFERLSR